MDKDILFTSFGKWLEPICLKTFKKRIDETHQDKYVKKLTTGPISNCFFMLSCSNVMVYEKQLTMSYRKIFKRNLGLNQSQLRSFVGTFHLLKNMLVQQAV
ncbi:hypothetical protein HQN89_24190 [Paenibacillus frigoriresistens]|uniref:hypothetical protein n=1 Tax=Paenibacillus alginolyticus TaxID=59839 RepID=UPI0015636A10|nr:hypothetical protein [Paenibacillus frigoriresistens]NRF94031.1 hypothetical protein [Paenibacillus frigoriresistens]